MTLSRLFLQISGYQRDHLVGRLTSWVINWGWITSGMLTITTRPEKPRRSQLRTISGKQKNNKFLQICSNLPALSVPAFGDWGAVEWLEALLGVKLGKIETEPGLKEVGQKQFQQDDFQSRLFLNTFSMCGGQKKCKCICFFATSIYCMDWTLHSFPVPRLILIANICLCLSIFRRQIALYSSLTVNSTPPVNWSPPV